MANLHRGDFKLDSLHQLMRLAESIDDSQYPLFLRFLEKKDPRTATQNSALHVFFRLQALEMNNAGFNKRMFFEKAREGFDVDWTEDSVKADIWVPLQKAMGIGKSTTKLSIKDVDKIYSTMVRGMGNIGAPITGFPSRG